VKGALTSDHTAYLSVVVVEAAGEYELIVDTGFSGFVYLPEDIIANWGLPFVSSAPIALADQSTVIVDVYETHLIWFGATLRVPVLAGPPGGDSLLGMELLEGCRIDLDRINAEIRIELL
jgi:clan AA aspartic protease